MSQTKMIGTISRKNSSGYGFIRPADGNKDIFFHASELYSIAFDDLYEGTEVSFKIEDRQKGLVAVEVEPIYFVNQTRNDGRSG